MPHGLFSEKKHHTYLPVTCKISGQKQESTGAELRAADNWKLNSARDTFGEFLFAPLFAAWTLINFHQGNSIAHFAQDLQHCDVVMVCTVSWQRVQHMLPAGHTDALQGSLVPGILRQMDLNNRHSSTFFDFLRLTRLRRLWLSEGSVSWANSANSANSRVNAVWCRVHTCTPLQVPFEPIWTSDVTQRFGSQQVSAFNCHINCPNKPCWDMVTDSCNRCFSSWNMDANPNRKNHWTNLQRPFLPRGTGLTLNTWKHALKDQVKTMNYRHKVATWNLWNIQLYRVNQCDIDHIKLCFRHIKTKRKRRRTTKTAFKQSKFLSNFGFFSTAFLAPRLVRGLCRTVSRRLRCRQIGLVGLAELLGLLDLRLAGLQLPSALRHVTTLRKKTAIVYVVYPSCSHHMSSSHHRFMCWFSKIYS